MGGEGRPTYFKMAKNVKSLIIFAPDCSCHVWIKKYGRRNKLLTQAFKIECFIHFEDVSQSLLKVTEKRLKRFIACHERSAKLEGQKSEISPNLYNLFY
jgi:hypothetical protein